MKPEPSIKGYIEEKPFIVIKTVNFTRIRFFYDVKVYA